MARGDGGKPVFIEREDRLLFLHCLARVCGSCGWRVHAWVLVVKARTCVGKEWLARRLEMGHDRSGEPPDPPRQGKPGNQETVFETRKKVTVRGLTLSTRGLASTAIDGVIYRIQGSADLASWNLPLTEVTGASGIAPPSASLTSGAWEYRSFRLTGSLQSRQKPSFAPR